MHTQQNRSTALHKACQEGHEQCAEILLTRAASPGSNGGGVVVIDAVDEVGASLAS